MTVFVNGQMRDWAQDFASYDEILACVFTAVPTLPVDVTYKCDGRSGVLMPGNSVRVETGMAFDVSVTTAV